MNLKNSKRFGMWGNLEGRKFPKSTFIHISEATANIALPLAFITSVIQDTFVGY